MRIEKKGQVFTQVGLLVTAELYRGGGDKGSALGKCFTRAITMIYSFLFFLDNFSFYKFCLFMHRL